ncbi:MAG: A/G-specific adenine glycosylase [Planctomycetaceae bacterium]|nr:A/G-specific adenine glycosylase [Planctomycetaceae bacterium]
MRFAAHGERIPVHNGLMPRFADQPLPMLPEPFEPSGRLGEEVAGPLLVWFDQEARELPWRQDRTPWRALVSELMLQQTQVSRVVDRFEGFLTRFPTPAAMVAAGEDAVLAAWEGLGYYRRARLLFAAAVRLVEVHGGVVPDDPAALLDLPGVGRYTAGAVASIVFGRSEPIVDGNVIRVVARLGAIDRTADDPRLVAMAWEASRRLVESTDHPGPLNESMMELGATVCTPSSPRCGDCPVRGACRGRASGKADSVPRPKTRPVRTVVHLHLLLCEDRGRLLLEPRPRGGIWGGLWQPPGLEAAAKMTPEEVAAGLGFESSTSPIPLARVKRLLTHREVHVHLLRIPPPSAGMVPESEVGSRRWFDRNEAAGLGMPKPIRNLLDGHADWTGETEAD